MEGVHPLYFSRCAFMFSVFDLILLLNKINTFSKPLQDGCSTHEKSFMKILYIFKICGKGVKYMFST
jgi:hypothetical protein